MAVRGVFVIKSSYYIADELIFCNVPVVHNYVQYLQVSTAKNLYHLYVGQVFNRRRRKCILRRGNVGCN